MCLNEPILIKLDKLRQNLNSGINSQMSDCLCTYCFEDIISKFFDPVGELEGRVYVEFEGV